MSSYPPPPPPSPASGYPPPFDRRAWKAQRRLQQQQQKAVLAQARQQARFQRDQLRAQARLQRRGSLVGPLLLVALGVAFLLTETGHMSWGHLIDWYARWWPAVMVAAGVLLIAEWGVARQRAANGVGYGAPVLGGGVVLLLILLASVGWSLRYANDTFWHDHFSLGDWGRSMGELHEADSALASPITTGEVLIVRCPHGDVTVSGSSQDGQVHVNVHKQVRTWNESDAAANERQLEPRFSNEGGQLVLSAASVNGGQADLVLEVPHDAAVTVEDDHGDITLSDLRAPVTLTAGHGNVDLNGINGTVSVHVNNDDASITGHSITGPVTVQGRSGDINFSDVNGSLSLEGDFFGSTHLERVNGAVRFHTSRTQFEAARLDGEFEVDTGADLQASELLGPVTLSTRNRNIQLDRVSGHVQITNRNGSVTVTNAPPFAGIQVVNERGSVDVGVPGDASFVVNAHTRHGDVENDFGLNHTGTDDAPELNGTVGKGGPLISLVTSDGDVTVRKSTVAPLPPVPPAAPRLALTPAPAPPPAPAEPRAPHAATGRGKAGVKAPPKPPAPPAALDTP